MTVRGFECASCSKVVIREPRKGAQKYCPDCSNRIAQEKHLKRCQKYRKTETYEKLKKAQKEEGITRERSSTRHDRLKHRGLERSNQLRRDNKWDSAVEARGFSWHTKIAIPWSKNLSKNSIWSHGTKQGHVFVRDEVKNLRAMIALAVRQNTQRLPVKRGKLWMGFHVQKPNHMSDAINVLDLLADAVKDGLSFDDNYYAIMFLDWEIVKDRPQVLMYLAQEVTEDQFVCSYCGREQPESEQRGERLCAGCSSA